ncbi:MAG: DUF1801 domain-containing protein [Tepidisphaera sp.]|nr:DUF1801 domain-containing protein [Tepidisphaera sp.]
MPLPTDIKDYHAALSPGDRNICNALAKHIAAHFDSLADSAGKVECKVWHRHPVWFLDGNPIVGYSTLKGPPPCVRLLFWSGQSFDEPALTPEGSFKAAEARFTTAADIPEKDLARWLTKSVAIQWDYKNIVKRKGKLDRLP